MSAAGIFPNEGAVPLAVAFLAEVFRQNPTRVAKWVAELADLPPEARRCLLQAVWESNTKAGKDLLAMLGAKDTAIANIEERAPVNLLAVEITSPSDLDMLWGTFMASGKDEPVARIISVLGWELPETKGDKRIAIMLIQGAADRSLRANAFEHQRVYEICKRQLSAVSAPIREKVEAILQSVDERRRRFRRWLKGQSSTPFETLLIFSGSSWKAEP